MRTRDPIGDHQPGSTERRGGLLIYFFTHRCWRWGSWKILAGMVDRRLRFRRRTCRLLDRLVKQPVSSEEMRLLFRNLECKTIRQLLHWQRQKEFRAGSRTDDTHRFLSGSTGKEAALMSVMALLLRSSVSRARKGCSCSGKMPAILLFALKTHGGSSKRQKHSPGGSRWHGVPSHAAH